jgi:hypothetical protein
LTITLLHFLSACKYIISDRKDSSKGTSSLVTVSFFVDLYASVPRERKHEAIENLLGSM